MTILESVDPIWLDDMAKVAGWNHEVLNVNLVVNGATIRCNSAFLIAQSLFFRTLLHDADRDETTSIHLLNLSADTAQLMVNAMQTGVVAIDNFEAAHRLLGIATVFAIRWLAIATRQWILDHRNQAVRNSTSDSNVENSAVQERNVTDRAMSGEDAIRLREVTSVAF